MNPDEGGRQARIRALEKRIEQPEATRHWLRRGLLSLRYNGVRVTWQKVKRRIRFGSGYQHIAKQALFSARELAAQREHRFPREIKFSVIVPLYNTPERFLRAMLESVQAQTYAAWELCLADGSDGAHGEVGQICQQYAEKDERIRYRKLEENLGISSNSNAALEMAAGEYIGLLDHDDLLHPAALHEVMRAICEKGADFIYTDESIFRDTPKDAYLSHFKPAFAPDTLRANNYIHNFGNRVVRWSINTLFHSDIKDIMTGYRAFSYRFVKTFPVLSTGFEIETEMSIHAVDKNMVVKNVIVGYRDRQAGSMSKLSTWSDGIKVLMTVFRLFRTYCPAAFFGAFAAFLAAVSVAFFVPIMITYIQTGLVPRFPTLIVCVFMMAAAIQAFFAGQIMQMIYLKSRQDFELQMIRVMEAEKRSADKPEA